jgi:phage-related protein
MPQGVKTIKIKASVDSSQIKPGADEAASQLERFQSRAKRAADDIGNSVPQGTGKAMSAVEGFGTKVKGVGADIVGSIGKFAAIGLAIGGISSVFNNAFEQINIKNILQAKLGVGTDIAKNAAQSLSETYKAGIGDSFSEVSDAVNAVASNLNGLTDTSVDSLNKLTPIALGLQKVYGVDVQEQLRAVSQLLKTGLVKDAQTGFDLIATAEQKFGAGAEDILDTFNEYSVQFKKIGVDGPEALGLINQLMKGGARNTDLAADALKEFAIRAVDGSATTISAYKALNLDVNKTTESMAKGGPVAQKTFTQIVDALKSVKDPAKQSQIAVELFGTQAEDLGSALYNLDATTATKSLGDFAGSAQAAADAVNKGPQQVISEFGRTLQDFATNIIGAYVIPAIYAVTNVLQTYLVPAFQAAETWLEQHIYPAFLLVFGWLQSNVYPILVGVGNAFGLIWSTIVSIWDQAVPYFTSIWNSIVANIWPIVQQIAVNVNNVWESMKPQIEVIKQFIVDHWDQIKVAIEIVGGAIAAVGLFIAAVLGGIALVIGILVVAFVGLTTAIVDYVSGTIKFFQMLKQVASDVGDGIKFAFNAVKATLSDVFNTIVRAGTDAFNNVKNKLNDFGLYVATVVNNIGRFFSSMWSGIGSGLKGALNGVIGLINGAIDKINTVTGVVGIGPIPHIPMLAKGGTAMAGRPYIVGEKGPELFEPNRTGRVVSNDAAFGDNGDDPIEIHVYIGDQELTQLVDTRVKVNNRQVKRSVRSGSTV